jgi:pimeloyl-ACP methyl ester carboxylesterase
LQQSTMGFQQHMQEKSPLSSHLSTTPPRVFHVLTDPPTLLRPTAEGATPRLPIVVLHGGPGVPSDYLLPLSALASDKRSPRAVYFYDQLGCGLSDEPKDFSFYSPSQAITSLFSFALIPRPLDRLLRCFFSHHERDMLTLEPRATVYFSDRRGLRDDPAAFRAAPWPD